MPPELTRDDLVLLTVDEVMSHPVIAVLAMASLGEALTAMLAAGVRHLAVVDEAGHCRGVLSDRAIAAIWAADPTALDAVAAAGALDRRPAVVAADATLGEVARMMYHDGVDAAAVIDRAGRAIGMVTGADLIGAIARHMAAATTRDARADQRPGTSGPST